MQIQKKTKKSIIFTKPSQIFYYPTGWDPIKQNPFIYSTEESFFLKTKITSDWLSRGFSFLKHDFQPAIVQKKCFLFYFQFFSEPKGKSLLDSPKAEIARKGKKKKKKKKKGDPENHRVYAMLIRRRQGWRRLWRIEDEMYILGNQKNPYLIYKETQCPTLYKMPNSLTHKDLADHTCIIISSALNYLPPTSPNSWVAIIKTEGKAERQLVNNCKEKLPAPNK